MSKKSVRIIALVISAILVIGILSACSSSDGGSYAVSKEEYSSYDGYYDGGEGIYPDDAYDNGSSSSGSSGGSSSGSYNRTAEDVTNSNRKIIENYSYTVETKTYPTFVSELEAQIKSLGGYVESLDSHNTASSGYIYSTYTVKIPTEKKDEFKAFIEENTNVLYNSVDTEDVTLKYIDVESRLKSLRLEQESLETLIKNAESVSDIIEVQERLSEVIYEIESYESQLRSLQADVDYTSFYLSVREVEHETVPVEDTVWQRIGSNLEKNFAAVGEFFEELFIGFISLLPLWIILGVLGLIALLIVKLSLKAARKRRAKREQDMKEHPEKYAPKAPRYPQYPPAGRPYPPQPYGQKPVPQQPVPQTPVQKPIAQQPAQKPAPQVPAAPVQKPEVSKAEDAKPTEDNKE